MKITKQANKRKKAVALLLVISVVALLGTIVFGLRLACQPSWDESTLEYNLFEAQMLAESGANLAEHPDIAPGDPLLRQDFGDGRSFEVTVSTEGGRIRVDNLADERVTEAVTNLFVLWGLDASRAAVAAESLADWVDTDIEARTSGAEQAYYAGLNYPQFPTNEPFPDVEVMLLVRGMDAVAQTQPLWRDYFTTEGDGLIDLNSASPELIESLMGVTPDAALSFVGFISGSDSLPNTEDDQLVTEVEDAQQLLGISPEEWQELSANITLTGSLRRIESIGRVGDVTYRLTKQSAL